MYAASVVDGMSLYTHIEASEELSDDIVVEYATLSALEHDASEYFDLRVRESALEIEGEALSAHRMMSDTMMPDLWIGEGNQLGAITHAQIAALKNLFISADEDSYIDALGSVMTTDGMAYCADGVMLSRCNFGYDGLIVPTRSIGVAGAVLPDGEYDFYISDSGSTVMMASSQNRFCATMRDGNIPEFESLLSKFESICSLEVPRSVLRRHCEAARKFSQSDVARLRLEGGVLWLSAGEGVGYDHHADVPIAYHVDMPVSNYTGEGEIFVSADRLGKIMMRVSGDLSVSISDRMMSIKDETYEHILFSKTIKGS
jgi:hypothetical protein